MSTPKPYDRIAFVASAGTEAQEALTRLAAMYGNHNPAAADVIVALGGDGLMLQTLHQHMHTGKPIWHAPRHRRVLDERVFGPSPARTPGRGAPDIDQP